MLRAGAYLEQLHRSVIFPLCVVKAHFELVGSGGVELHEFLAFCHSGPYVHKYPLYAVGRRRGYIVGLECLNGRCILTCGIYRLKSYLNRFYGRYLFLMGCSRGFFGFV